MTLQVILLIRYLGNVTLRGYFASRSCCWQTSRSCQICRSRMHHSRHQPKPLVTFQTPMLPSLTPPRLQRRKQAAALTESRQLRHHRTAQWTRRANRRRSHALHTAHPLHLLCVVWSVDLLLFDCTGICTVSQL